MYHFSVKGASSPGKELDFYVTKRVKELTKGAQHPTTEIPKTMPNFPVVYR